MKKCNKNEMKRMVDHKELRRDSMKEKEKEKLKTKMKSIKSKSGY